jgi:hypothetical protein
VQERGGEFAFGRRRMREGRQDDAEHEQRHRKGEHAVRKRFEARLVQ